MYCARVTSRTHELLPFVPSICTQGLVYFHVSCTTDHFVRIIYDLIHMIHFHTLDLFDMYDFLNRM